MKTEQAIRKLGQTLWDILGREYIDKYCEDKNGNLVSVSSISVDGIAEELVKAGFGDVSEYKAEIERLKAKNERVLGKLADVLMCIKSTTEIDVSKLVKQAKIDVLKELKERITKDRVANDTVVINANCEINELIKEVENAEDKG